jgi:protocatechuate 3,4-dioxygenase beta subunit
MKRLALMSLLVAGLLVSAAAWLQQSRSGFGQTPVTVSGKVTDEESSPVPLTQLEFVDSSSGQSAGTATTESQGDYSLNVAPSTYDVTVTPPTGSGLQQQTLQDVAVSSDTTLNVVLLRTQPVELINFTAQVADRSGRPVPNLFFGLSSDQGQGLYDLTDAQGRISLRFPSGSDYMYMLNGMGSPPVLADFPTVFYLGKSIDLTQDTDLTIVLQNRVLTVTVLDPQGNPVPNVVIRLPGDETHFSFNGFSGTQQVSSGLTTDSQGEARFDLFQGSSIDLSIVPTADSGFAPTSVPNTTVIDDMSITVTVQPEPVVNFTAQVADRSGRPVPNLFFGLSSDQGQGLYDLTDAQGRISLRFPSGSDYMYMLNGMGSPPVLADFPTVFYLGKSIDLTQDTDLTIVLQNRVLTVTVLDPQGNPVPNVVIRLPGDETHFSFNGFSGTQQVSSGLTTDSQGEARFDLFQGSSSDLSIVPTADSGFAAFTVPSVGVTQDTNLAILLYSAITPNTPVGTNVLVSLRGGLGTVGGIAVTFSSVTESGNTTLVTSNAGPPPPTGFKIVGLSAQPVYYDINTTATFPGAVTVCITYDETQVHGTESKLKLMHHDGTGFANITTSLDTVNNVICGTTTTLSPFAVVEPESAPPPAVGGIAELPDLAAASAAGAGTPSEGSGWSPSNHAALGGGLAAALVALTAGAWYVRRRWLRRRA